MVTKDNSISKAKLLEDFWGCVAEKMSLFGDKDFLVTKSGKLTFSEAENKSNILCQKIKTIYPAAKIGVGIYLRDPRRVVECMLAVAKANDYFLILDVSFPEITINSMIDDSEIRVILTETQYIEQIRAIAGNHVLLLNLDEIDYSVNASPFPVKYSPDDKVQIMYTSGSSGKPKGAIEDYRYLTRAVYVKATLGGFKLSDRLLQLSSFTFSGQHTSVFAGLVIGYSIYFHDVKEDGFNALPDWINKNNLTTFQSTVTTFRSFISTLKNDEQFHSVRYFHIGGEKRNSNDVKLIKRHFPKVNQIVLGYAGTEMFQVSISSVPIDVAATYDILPCGQPIRDIKVFIWNEKGESLPAGSEGEVVVYGDSLARGYINNPELNRLKFHEDNNNPGWYYFKTGDNGMIMDDGQLFILGRKDNMVKIKGVRIEVDTIERLISSYPGVVLVAAKVFINENGIERLASYYTVEEGISVPVSDLRKHLAESLPIQQLPSYFICLDKMPVSATGKIDNLKLPLPSTTRPDLGYPFVPPETHTEQRLISIWEEQLGITGIGVTDDFFDVGGDSLIGVIVFSAIEELFGKTYPVSTILTAPCIRDLAMVIDGKKQSGTESLCISINPEGQKPPLFFIPGKGGYPTRIKHLAKHLDPEIPVYAFQSPVLGQKIKITNKVKYIADKFLQEIRARYKDTSVILVGESVGGKIAFEIAQQITQITGYKPIVFLLDTYHQESAVPNAFRNTRSWKYLRMLLRKHALILIKANWQGKKEYLDFYRSTIMEKISKYINHRILKRNGSSLLKKHEKLINFEADTEISKGYEAKPYPGKVILLIAQRGATSSGNVTHGWDKVGIKDLIVEKVDCYHGSMLFEPAVSNLANIIQSHL